MPVMLAAAKQADAIIWQKIVSMEMPMRADYTQDLVGLGSLPGLLILAGGFVSLFYGWKIHKWLVVGNALYVGALVGAHLGSLHSGENTWIITMFSGALLLGAVSWTLMKGSISVMGAAAGGIMGYGIWHYAASIAGNELLTRHAWAGGSIGVIGLGLLALLLFRTVVMVFSAVEGTLLMVSGVLSLLLKYEPYSKQLLSSLNDNAHLLPMLIAVPGMIGFIVQFASYRKKLKKKRKATEGSGD